MGKTNGKTEVENPNLDLEHELPPSDDDGQEQPPTKAEGQRPEPAVPPEIEKLKTERDTLVDRLARLQAEFENARKRAAREQQDHREYALVDALKALLPILDSFDRALRTTSSEAAEFRSGIELIHKQLHDTLVKLGLRPIPARGERFDPRLHEAIEMVDSAEARDHEVLEELQRGYKFKDRLLRPAMVKVARNPKA